MAVNPAAHTGGTIAVLRDGHKAIDLDDARYPETERNAIRAVVERTGAPLYVVHWITCPAKGLRHAGWLTGRKVDSLAKADPTRDKAQSRNLTDQARDIRKPPSLF